MRYCLRRFFHLRKLHFLFIISPLCISLNAQDAWHIDNPFEQKNFVQNNKQFNLPSKYSEFEVGFVAINNGLTYYFSKTGILISQIVQIEEEDVDQQYKKGKEHRLSTKEIFFKIDFKNSSTKNIIANGIKSNYYTFFKERNHIQGTEISRAYETITYEDVYPGVSLKIYFPQDSTGIKYSFEANRISDLKNVSLQLDSAFEVDSKPTLFGAHAGDLTFITSSNGIINNKNEIRYTGLEMDINSRLSSPSISGWLNSVNLTGNNGAFDIDYDKLGNVYVYGGSSSYTLNKYDPNGNLLWSTTPFNSDQYM